MKRHMRTENKKQIGAARIGSSLTLIRSRVIMEFAEREERIRERLV